MSRYLIQDTTLKEIADAVRLRTGKTDAILTKNIASEIENIPGSTLPDSPLPIEISTEEEMTALLETAEIGSVYKYVGTTGIYENGALYVVEENL